MARVEGIGGVFIYSNHAERLASWYQDVLGIDMERHPDGTGFYHVFLTRDRVSSVLRENPVLAINQSEQSLAGVARQFVLNLRVDDLDTYLEQLRDQDVAVEPDILEWERGKHAWIADLDDNRIELYEEIFPTPQQD